MPKNYWEMKMHFYLASRGIFLPKIEKRKKKKDTEKKHLSAYHQVVLLNTNTSDS